MSFYLKNLIERDKNLLKLESDVFSKLKEIAGPEIPQKNKQFEIKNVNLEEAIKQLLNIRKSS